MSLLLQIDGRRRISLGAMAKHQYYFAEEQEDGVIALTPAVVLPASEVASRVDAFLGNPEAGVRRTREGEGS